MTPKERHELRCKAAGIQPEDLYEQDRRMNVVLGMLSALLGILCVFFLDGLWSVIAGIGAIVAGVGALLPVNHETRQNG